MKISALEYFPYLLRADSPIKTSGARINRLKGFTVMVRSGDGFTGYGDCAIAESLGTESFSDAEKKIKELQITAPGNHIAANPDKIESFLAALNGYPAIRYAMEEALIFMFSEKAETDPSRLLNLKPVRRIPVSALIGIHTKDITLKKTRFYVSLGYKTLKLKAGRSDFRQDLKILSDVRKYCGEKISIRIDINARWNFIQALDRLNALRELNPEYVEQPVAGTEDFRKLRERTDIPLAIDEPVRNFADAMTLISENTAEVVIIKPLLLGGILNSLKIIRLGEKKKIKTVISSGYENLLGKLPLITLASVVKGSYAHGLVLHELPLSESGKLPYTLINGNINYSPAMWRKVQSQIRKSYGGY